MKTTAAFLITSLLFSTAHALVDMRNANFADTWTDLQLKNSGYDLRVQRTYNSRTLFNGMFGFGWCSDFETKLQVNPEGSVRVTECGAGYEIEYKPKNFTKKNFDKTVQTIMAEVRKRNKNRDERYFKNLEIEIRRDSLLRDEFSRQLNLNGKALDGTEYYADGRINDSIKLKGDHYIRSLPNGTFQRFDKQGKLLQMNDRNGNFIKLSYDGPRVKSVVDNSGNSLSFKYKKNSKYVSEVVGPSGLKAAYVYKGETLVEVTNAWKNKFKYQYDELYNLTRIDYPDKTFVQLTYDKDRDWVMSFRDRRGCVESYKYIDGAKDPVNNYKSEVIKKCGNKVTNRSSYEFWHKTRKDGTRYLAKTKAVKNNVTTETEYHEVYGRPTLIVQNNVATRFEYLNNGLLKTRIEPNRVFNYKYSNKCGKVSEVAVRYTTPTPVAQQSKGAKRQPSKAQTKVVTTKFGYNERNCNLVTARNSEGQAATLTYDIRGRITRIVDQSKKEVLITYEERFGKPLVVTRPGLGTIKFKYKPNGEVEKIDSNDEPLVAVQVANIFSNLLDIIAPATTDTPI